MKISFRAFLRVSIYFKKLETRWWTAWNEILCGASKNSVNWAIDYQNGQIAKISKSNIFANNLLVSVFLLAN